METEEIFNFDIRTLFDKKFTFEKQDDWNLSDISIEHSKWSIESLNNLKKDLNNTKSLLNDKGQDWHEHTARINKASFVISAIKEKIHPEIITQAWCKFYEIISSYNLIHAGKIKVRSLHLCEAPGAFISALNYYLCVHHPTMDWEWMANTLNPYYEGHSIRNVVVDDRLLLPTLKHWYFGEDNTGDITDINYIDEICQIVPESALFDLVTADGSVDCLNNPGEQEALVENIHFSEVLIALNCLLPQGCLVLKKFTFFESSSICQLFLLNCVFEKVHVFKPFTSRPSNSEVYVICIGFRSSEVLKNILQKFKVVYREKNAVSTFPRSSIPESFVLQIEECMKFFTDLQIKSINENLMLYPIQDDLITKKLNNYKQTCAEAYINKYSVNPNPIYDTLKLSSKKKVFTSFSKESDKDLKELYFHCVGDTFNNIMKSSSMQWYDKLIDVEKRIDICFPNSRKRPFEKIEWIYPWKEIRKRMKSKHFNPWIIYGKKFTCINNSKFCYPTVLHLWNRISLDPQVDESSHIQTSCHQYTDTLKIIFDEDGSLGKQSIGVFSVSENNVKNDPLLSLLKKEFDFKVSFYAYMGMDPGISIPQENFINYINASSWNTSLNNECIVKEDLTELILNALMILKEGDTLLFCIQSVLTRYMAGLIFMLISLFDKFTTILPEQYTSACMGQIWIFNHFRKCSWADNVLKYLKSIKEKRSEGKEILEIVPITSLCDSSFYGYIHSLNNKHLLQRLKAFISTEKSKIGISVENGSK